MNHSRSDTADIGRITLSRMLSRGTNVRSDTLDKLCAYFDCRIEQLVEYVPDDSLPVPTKPAAKGGRRR